MKRPHADLIHAWADGEQIQFRAHDSAWVDKELPAFNEFAEYRIKPAPKKYRVALCICSPCIAFDEEQAASLSGMRGFIRWLDDWKYYEEESC